MEISPDHAKGASKHPAHCSQTFKGPTPPPTRVPRPRSIRYAIEKSVGRRKRLEKVDPMVSAARTVSISGPSEMYCSEYGDDIREYLAKLEIECMVNPEYMSGQTEITWEMRRTAIDHVARIHGRHLLPAETLWIAVNLFDRFLSIRIVALQKLSLLVHCALFIAWKYEEISTPRQHDLADVLEDMGISFRDLIAGEKIMLQALKWKISRYCSPYPWLKVLTVDQKTLVEFLLELTLLDHRFIGIKPSAIAAVATRVAEIIVVQSESKFANMAMPDEGKELQFNLDLLAQSLSDPKLETCSIYIKHASDLVLLARTWAVNFVATRPSLAMAYNNRFNEELVTRPSTNVHSKPQVNPTLQDFPASPSVPEPSTLSIVKHMPPLIKKKLPLTPEYVKAKKRRAENRRACLSRTTLSTFHILSPSEMDCSEYADEILAHMNRLEGQCMPSHDYMAGQLELEWGMRRTVVDYMFQIHSQFSLCPDTLWIAVNNFDRMLSLRVISLVKLGLVAWTALFIAWKYEEDWNPFRQDIEFALSDAGFSFRELMIGEKIMLQDLDYHVFGSCSPYPWIKDLRGPRRELCEFLLELTLLDHHFLAVIPSEKVKVAIYTTDIIIGHHYLAHYPTEAADGRLRVRFNQLLDALSRADLERLFVYKKHDSDARLHSSATARMWAIKFTSLRQGRGVAFE